MSSHHIVREKQEPALYIHRLGAFDEEYLGQLLEWSPTLIVDGREYEKVLSLGLKIDIVANPDGVTSFQENTRLIYTEEENITGIISFLISEKYPAVNIISDSNIIEELATFVSDIDIVLFTEYYKSYPIKSGFNVWKPEGSLFRLAEETEFKGTNLAMNGGGDYEVLRDGFVEFTFSSPYLFISELL